MNIKPLNNANPKQIFAFYTEESWAAAKQDYLNISDFFSAKKNETFIFAEGDKAIYLTGLGSSPKIFEFQQVASKFSYDFRKKIRKQPTVLKNTGVEAEHFQELVNGLFLGTYEYPFKQNHPLFDAAFELLLDVEHDSANRIALKTNALMAGQFACMEWLNKPQNFKKVPQITQFLKDISARYNFNIQILDREECENKGLGAFLAVNQGSAQQAAFTILEYKPVQPAAKTVGLVGKCVLFDTGGISLKPGENMHYMKSDMGGATAVIGALITAAEQEVPVHIVAVLPITDNAVSNTAYMPSDVVTAYNGKTIEVLNTDAEGRMTLADGLSYLAKHYRTDALIDIATLTGSAVRMFGYTCGALFSNNDTLKDALLHAGDRTNQRLWPLPLWEVWKDDFSSDVADFKNISSKPFGDCIVAAKFLEQFTGEHSAWAHLDIAGVAFGNTLYAKEKAATGYGVQLLVNFLENFS